MKRARIVSVFSVALGLAIGSSVSAAPAFPDPPKETSVSASQQTAVLAGGCFWGMAGVFERLKGVVDVVSGYSGGTKETAHYEMVGTGTTGHAESIQVTYDPSKISYGTVLKIYFSIAHDPTQLDYQGPDEGTQYRSAIFYQNDQQKRVAQEYIRILTAAKVFPSPIVTQVVPFKAFYPAEDYHQNFLDKNPSYPYIVAYDLPKIAALQDAYPQLLSGKFTSVRLP